MKAMIKMRNSLLVLLALVTTMIDAQVKTLDDFESKDGWSFIRSDGVNLDLSLDKGFTGKAVRFDYDFTKGTGYGGIQKWFPIDLPDNYEFTFYIKAESPANNLEIKFIDSTGNNVWWVNNHNYDFPKEWKKITIKKRHISFAWGPIADHSLKRIDRIEFTISSFVGGKGTIWLDDLKFEPLPPETQNYPLPAVTASSSGKDHAPELVLDNSDKTYWQSKGAQDESLLFDFKTRREFGGLQLDWLKNSYAKSFEIFLSDDSKTWEKAYSVSSNGSDVSFIRLPEAEANYLRINLIKSNGDKGFGVYGIRFLDIRNSTTPNDFFIYTSKNSPAGDYPRYFSEHASYWTICGVNGDVKEALINEDGMIEVDKAQFSIEPMIRIHDSLYNWSNVKSVQFLGTEKDSSDFTFIPSVSWQCNELKFVTGVTSAGEANKNSRLDIRYSFDNHSTHPQDFEFYLLIRPFQVNPYYQFLNLTGGVGKIHSIKEENNGLISADDKIILPQKKYNAFGAACFDEGNIVDLLRSGKIPLSKTTFDPAGLANGVIKYSIHLNPGEHTELFVVVPFYGRKSMDEKFSVGKCF